MTQSGLEAKSLFPLKAKCAVIDGFVTPLDSFTNTTMFIQLFLCARTMLGTRNTVRNRETHSKLEGNSEIIYFPFKKEESEAKREKHNDLLKVTEKVKLYQITLMRAEHEDEL